MYKILSVIFLALILFTSCNPKKKKPTFKHTNNLINETSPYLLQHAHNPVNWHAWNDETLAKAKKENKLILISIGYAACHWCHVMEHESFENDSVAKIMNDNFINIKIDREERPDIDQIYMNAVQLMTGSGGWPLNCVALPNGEPFWGGTYFPKENWINTLSQLAKLYKEEPEKIAKYANDLTKGIQASELITLNTDTPKFETLEIEKAIQNWSTSFDYELGGLNQAPKFPMPNNYQFLLRFSKQTKQTSLEKYTLNTLNKMALGGIFDHVNGGFSRYATDKKWHIPHFEKMLYDNAQLVSLYSNAFLASENPLYENTVHKTLAFVARELTNKEGAFYSSLDADSLNDENHLEEGAFYVWTKDELQTLIPQNFELFSNYYNCNEFGHWEENKYHLIKKQDDISFAKENKLPLTQLKQLVQNWEKTLFKARLQKQLPRLDHKTLTSWNALMLKAYVDAYNTFQKPSYLNAALKNALFLKQHQFKKDGGLYHNYKNGKSSINGYLEDYAAVIEAYISLYETTLDTQWLLTAKNLATYCYTHFFDQKSKMFFFTSNEDQNLIARKMEIADNVIPSSNSMLANSLFKLSHYFDDRLYRNTSIQMLNNVKKQLNEYPSSYANWLNLYLNLSEPFYEVAIVGNNAKNKVAALNNIYIPNKIIAGSAQKSDLPLLKNRYINNETFIYTCVDGACKLPVKNVSDAINEIVK